MIEIWNLLLFNPLLNLIVGLYKLTGNLGWSIILLTVGLRLVMTPLILPGLKTSKKMQDLAPDLEKLKAQFKDDKQGLITAQAKLYRENGLNPASGCLPQIVQILVLIALFNAFNSVLKSNGQDLVANINPHMYSFNRLADDFHLTTNFLWLDLTKPDVIPVQGIPFPLPGLFLLLSALSQLLSSKMMMPAVKKQEVLAKKTPGETDDIMAQTQQQMLYMFPLMTVIFGFQFPAGLVLYWLTFSIISMIQQYFATGWGGLASWIHRLKMVKS